MARTVEQATRLKEGLAGLDGITLVTPAGPGALGRHRLPRRAGDTPPANAVQSLREQGIVASATPYRTSYLRLGPSIVTAPSRSTPRWSPGDAGVVRWPGPERRTHGHVASWIPGSIRSASRTRTILAPCHSA